MYSILFNEITDIVEQLQAVQRKTEELYISSSETTISIFDKTGSRKDEEDTAPAGAPPAEPRAGRSAAVPARRKSSSRPIHISPQPTNTRCANASRGRKDVKV